MLDDDPIPTELEEASREAIVPCELVTGKAGTGKTFEMKRRISEDPGYGVLAATTGIAAVNLNAVTVNSLLKFFDTSSLRDSYLAGHLTRILHQLALDHRHLVIDEVSMMDADQLDLIYRAMGEANSYRDIREPMGLVLVGDFAQLPPVRARWAFEADCWPSFAASTTKLTKVWRQDQSHFLDALNLLRSGRGPDAADLLAGCGVRWHDSLDTSFDGTTIVPKNDQVDRYNWEGLGRVHGMKLQVTSRRWGACRGEWRQIPERADFKIGAYVMILSNAPIEDGWFEYVNGDTGHIVSFDDGEFQIELVRTGQTVSLPKLVRSVAQKDKPVEWAGGADLRQEGYVPRPHRDDKGRYVLGQVEWYPLRLAYASTVHKSQGLSLDRIQVDVRNQFFSSYGMVYVALSRCRTLEGLRIVGQKDIFARRCTTDPRIAQWI